MALVFEAYGALCFLALIAFLVLAAAAKLRPDLEEEELDLAELDKLKKLVGSDSSHDAPAIEPPILGEPFSPPASRPAKQGKRPIGRRTVAFHARHPRTT